MIGVAKFQTTRWVTKTTIAGVTAAVVAACLVLDLVGETPVVSALLEIAACTALAWCVWARGLRPLSRTGLIALGLAATFGLVCAAQLLDLPFAWWKSLPGRLPIEDGFRLLGIGEISQPVSLSPLATVNGLFRFLPPVAVFVLACRVSPTALFSLLPWPVPGLAALSASLSLALHLVRGVPADLELIRHTAVLQIVSIPFLLVLFARIRSRLAMGEEFHLLATAAVACMGLGLAVLLVSKSGVLIYAAGVVAALSTAATFGIGRIRITGAILAGAGLIFALAWWMLGERLLALAGASGWSATGPVQLAPAWSTANSFWPVGAGLGAFAVAYPAHDPAWTSASLPVAPNGYLELWAELGLAGCVIVAAMFGGWLFLYLRTWRPPFLPGAAIRQAAGLALGALFVLCAVDAAMQAEAILCVAALCLAIMISGDRPEDHDKPSAATFQHRHIEL